MKIAIHNIAPKTPTVIELAIDKAAREIEAAITNALAPVIAIRNGKAPDAPAADEGLCARTLANGRRDRGYLLPGDEARPAKPVTNSISGKFRIPEGD